MSNLNDAYNKGAPEAEGKPSVKQTTRRREPPSEKLPNFSRVTPAQMNHISFPSDARYQPVRSLSPPTPSGGGARDYMNLYAGGGGILLVVDRQPEEKDDLIELEEADVAMEDPGNDIAPPTPMLEDGPEATPPEPFEVSSFP
jgi:26S proteasome regulatory subunit N2